MSRSPGTLPARSTRKSLIDVIAAVSTVLALFIALLAWLFPRSPNPGAVAEPGQSRASAQPSISALRATDSTDPTVVSSAGPTPTTHDTSLAYDRTELTINCGTGVDIDLDEPRVFPVSGEDLTYHCIDQEFWLATDAAGGYANTATPATLNTCLEALRVSAFDETTTRVSAGLSFCVATADQAHDKGKIVHVKALTDGWSGHVTIAVTAWRKPAAQN
ncbi:hypothetical protein ACQP2E_04100 [Actinoplanes sp. CA-015351]|uniref:hypothetical protein n=1 Tax=Actinoplanes sp. CA-015351 TaxID=3239897 RepID=UPI003D971847